MLWLLSKNLYREKGYDALLSSIQRFGIKYQIVTPVPFADDILVSDDVDLSKAMVDHHLLPQAVVNADDGVWVMGSYSLCRIAAAKGWKPSAYFKGLSYEEWSVGWGDDNILNPNAKVLRFADVTADLLGDTTFIRPALDSKSFSGRVYERKEFLSWQREVLHVVGTDTSEPLNMDTLVVLSPPVNIQSETRFFVVNGEIVTGSLYKRGRQVFYSEDINDTVRDFACYCVDKWKPNPAFVIDIAETDNGLKVVEANCLNAAGFYAADVGRLVASIADYLEGEQR